MYPFGGEPKYEKVSAYLAANAHTDDAILVWGSAPEIYWASGLRPATRFITTNTFLAGNHPGRTETSIPPSEIDPQMWAYFYEDFDAHPPRYILDTSPAKVRGAEYSPMSQFPEFAARVEARLPPRAHHRRDRRLRAQRLILRLAVTIGSDERPGRRAVVVGVREPLGEHGAARGTRPLRARRR